MGAIQGDKYLVTSREAAGSGLTLEKIPMYPRAGQIRGWLTEQGVIGYAQSPLVVERFGYPGTLRASADEFVGQQYAVDHNTARSATRSSAPPRGWAR